MKNKRYFLLIVIFLVAIIPRFVKADVCDNYQCITCVYKATNFNITYNVKSDGTLDWTLKKTNSKSKVNYSMVSSVKYKNFLNNEKTKLVCPKNLIYKRSSNTKNSVSLHLYASGTSGTKIKLDTTKVLDNQKVLKQKTAKVAGYNYDCDKYQCITCNYKGSGYNVTFTLRSSGSATKEGYFAVKNSGKKADVSSINYFSFVSNKQGKLVCPNNLKYSNKNKTPKLQFGGEGTVIKANKDANTTNGKSFLASSETNWGSVSNTNLETICSKPELRKPLKFIGTLVNLVKIIVPLLIIGLGIVDLYKAVTKSNEIASSVRHIAIRAIAGVAIFFLPGIVQMLLNWVNEFSNYQNTWCCCTQCILDSNNCDVNSCSSDTCSIGGMN